jgi:uncharacterized protein (TIGR02466 family)
MQVSLEFATPIARVEIDQSICKHYTSLISKYLVSKADLVQNTPDDLHTQKEFADLVKLIDVNVTDFCNNIIGVDKNSLKLNGMWANAHQSGSLHQSHQHPNSFVSGVIYLQIPDCIKEGNLHFVDPRQAKNMTYADFKIRSCISDRSIYITPYTGLFLLFPSWLEHGTELFVSNTTDRRISLSFNYSLISCNFKTMKL